MKRSSCLLFVALAAGLSSVLSGCDISDFAGKAYYNLDSTALKNRLSSNLKSRYREGDEVVFTLYSNYDFGFKAYLNGEELTESSEKSSSYYIHYEFSMPARDSVLKYECTAAVFSSLSEVYPSLNDLSPSLIESVEFTRTTGSISPSYWSYNVSYRQPVSSNLLSFVSWLSGLSVHTAEDRQVPGASTSTLSLTFTDRDAVAISSYAGGFSLGDAYYVFNDGSSLDDAVGYLSLYGYFFNDQTLGDPCYLYKDGVKGVSASSFLGSLYFAYYSDNVPTPTAPYSSYSLVSDDLGTIYPISDKVFKVTSSSGYRLYQIVNDASFDAFLGIGA